MYHHTPSFPWRLMVLLLCAALLVACSSPGPAERQARRLQLVQDVAGAPVESFHFWRLDRWEPLGRRHLAVWTRLDTAYLLQVDEPCSGLEFTVTIGLSSTGQRVYQRFDDVFFEHQRCRIAEIRPIDVKALKAASRGEDPSKPVAEAAPPAG